jgi:hypothetical protein
MPTGDERRSARRVEQARDDVARGKKDATARMRGAVRRLLRHQGHAPPLIDALAAKIVERLDAFQQAGSEVEPGKPPLPVACCAGCSSCCSLWVGVTAPEVFKIADHVRQAFTPEQQAALRDRVVEKFEQTRKLENWAQYQEAEIECALLLPDGHCSVYSVRPVMCRGHSSVDAQQCWEHLTEWSDYPLTYRPADKMLSQAALDGTDAALEQHGFDRPRELTEGMFVALTEPDAMARWLRGEPVFAEKRP